MARKKEKGVVVGNYAVALKGKQDMLAKKFDLSTREAEVLYAFMCGKTGPVIANELGVTSNTLSTFRRRIFSKLGVQNMNSAVALATACLCSVRLSRALQ